MCRVTIRALGIVEGQVFWVYQNHWGNAHPLDSGHGADLAEVQEWLGHANISTTRLYVRKRLKPEDNPTFEVQYKGKPA